jgi:flagellar hook assembly protein FlgD
MVVNGVDEIDVVTPAVFTLGNAYPNPFNPSTSISLDISDAGNVNVAVYNLMGQVVSTLTDGYMNAGIYTLTWDASDQVSGMYLVRAETAEQMSTQKLLLIK